ncbi:MAG: GspE/PulE family protein [Candidatus Dojkabacteria bacterium]|jgi:type II secretory ATPase GspE/PulE/Tfp pilus assembly ATPase PilB-like protein|nr:GspE/PulE family protein [Candidatus Dojkabacteria bacterium]
MVELLKAIDDVSKKKQNVSDLLDIIVREAFERKASDIHLEAREGNNLLVRFRIDGMLRDMVTIGNNLEESILFIIKVRAKLRTDIHFAPQDGKILFSFKNDEVDLEKIEGKKEDSKEESKEAKGEKKEEVEKEKVKEVKEEEKKDLEDKKGFFDKLKDGSKKEQKGEVYRIDARISILPVTYGEKVVIRLLSQTNRAFGLADLGFEPEDLEKVEASYREPYGLILATGPTGSGKTTSLYSILKILNTREVNITTIEDPVEYNIVGVNHIQINTKSDLTFANGLRSILRQDPNIIMVGEIRDTETARITVNSALTGHLVLSTVHANDAISAIPRLIDMGIEPFLVASTVNIIISQRLARRLCDNCKTEYSLSKDGPHKEMLKFRPDVAKLLGSTDKLYKANGCSQCDNTGYSGRIGLYEVLRMNKDIRDVVISQPNTDTIYAAAKKSGYKLMIEEGVGKLKRGVIDLEELIRVVAIKE